ncbi:MAG: hypothetical protein C0490_25785, partial [Marivirga sp.]|nr:hypothetical protein [Marivirga sp.]
MRNLKTYASLGCILLLMGHDFAGYDLKNAAKISAEEYKLIEAFPALTFDMPVELTSPEDNTDRI